MLVILYQMNIQIIPLQLWMVIAREKKFINSFNSLVGNNGKKEIIWQEK